MNVKPGLTSFLKVIILLAGMAILALCIFFVPPMAHFASSLYPNFYPMNYLIFIVMYGSTVPFYIALYQAFNLLRYIEANTAFSELSVKALKYIKWCAIIISGLHLLASPLFHFITNKMDPPFGIVGLLIIFASLVIAIFAAVLQRLLQEVTNIKLENDLTV